MKDGGHRGPREMPWTAPMPYELRPIIVLGPAIKRTSAHPYIETSQTSDHCHTPFADKTFVPQEKDG